TTNVYIKTYDYPTPGDRRRGFGRTTWLARSRAHAEWAALEWFENQGLEGARGLLVAERRRFGVLRRAVLVTEAWRGRPANEALAAMSRADGDELVAAIRAKVAEWHARGFRDRNLDLRNLLVRRLDGVWSVVKIDSPRWRLRSGGAPTDRLARSDRARLDADLATIGY
ncbi:MAG: hypothetical protein KDB80_10715, partial [Planctomycetes bacterium]|nr:hypothetical protein [Planctomycetota bacterium]